MINFKNIFIHRLAEILEGKGNGKGNRYQAKVKNLKNVNKAELLIKEAAL